ncbi:hypothetical protein O181_085297 [Austropuccinia psidii MF-1]|uniref:Uncharacterized protein n=1 Tax=Austropuccinia psidii MF-1 TaxID=1389203 RepID=A0A9Q3FXS7_9BASI|nr:hypothetical protein [Austropuccinia psidii MF-1]
MSSKLTELTKSSPSALPPSVICHSGILSSLASPWSMASSGNFDPSKPYSGYKAVEILDPACTKCLAKGKYFFQNYNPQSSKCHFCFVGKKPCCCTMTGSRQRDVARWTDVGGRQICSSSEVLISRINTEGVVKMIRKISSSAADPDSEGSNELDGEEVEVVYNSIGHQSSTSPSHPPAKRFQSHIIPRTPRTFQPTPSTIPTTLPPAPSSSSTTRPALIPEVRPSPIP